MSQNPFEPPDSTRPTTFAFLVDGDSGVIRENFGRHESSIRILGWQFMAVGALCGFAAVHSGYDASQSMDTTTATMSAAYGALAVIGTTVGWGLSTLRPWARVPAVTLGLAGAMIFPIGTMIGGYAVFLLLSSKTRVILSAEYDRIVAETLGFPLRWRLLTAAFRFLLVAGIGVVIFVALVIVLVMGLRPTS